MRILQKAIYTIVGAERRSKYVLDRRMLSQISCFVFQIVCKNIDVISQKSWRLNCFWSGKMSHMWAGS